jgi:hypothetical protein
MAEATTGTVYGLTDPRDGEIHYIGATIKTPDQRLKGHYGNAARRVTAWIAELTAAGLRPGTVAIRENVPVAELEAAEHEEITRIVAAGGKLLNEQKTARGRKLLAERCAAELRAAEHGAWAELAAAAQRLFGGPLPPGGLPDVEIPEVSWEFISQVKPDHDERMRGLIGTNIPLWEQLSRFQELATDELRHRAQGAWGTICGLADDSFSRRLELSASIAATTPSSDRADVSRHLALSVWYMVAVDPWRHLAQIAGLPLDDASFIAWAARGDETREALEFLAGRHGRVLAVLAGDWEGRRWLDVGPGRMLATTAAASAGIVPARAIRRDVIRVLQRLADDHQLTSSTAGLMTRLDPRALDTAFGQDVAAELDTELGLPPGTSGRVARALVGRLNHAGGEPLRRVADRSAQALPVVALPDYQGFAGPGVPAARIVGASLVRAGLAAPDGMSAGDYLASVRALWAPDDARWRQQAA